MPISAKCSLKYNANTREITAHFTLSSSETFAFDPPYSNLIEKAHERLDKAKNDHDIAFYCVFTERLQELYAQLSQLKDIPKYWPTSQLKIQLAKGFKTDFLISQIELFSDDQQKVRFSLKSLPSQYPESFEEALFAKLYLQAQHERVPLGIHFAQCVMFAKKHAKTAQASSQQNNQYSMERLEDIRNFPPKQFILNQDGSELYFCLHKPIIEANQNFLDSIVDKAVSSIKQLQSSKQQKFLFLKQSLIMEIKKLAAGMNGEDLYVFLPSLVPIAYTQQSPTTETDVAAQNSDYPAKGLLKLDLSEDHMSATIREWDMGWYFEHSENLNESWLERELRRYNIPFNQQKNLHLNDILDHLLKKQDLSGEVIAEGVKPQAGKKPYIAISEFIPENIETSGTINPRDTQFLKLYPPNTLCGELKFNELPIIGRNIYGDQLNAPIEHNIQILEGIEEREPGRFYSTRWGVPVVDKNSFKLNEVYQHQGDVNLVSGNIYFDGPVHISGSIDIGATVLAKGDLVVEGNIGSATVICQGNLKVGRGIVMGEKGSIFVKGDAIATFIENATITVAGNLEVSKSILNSKIVVGKKILLSRNSGIISGGEIYCREAIYAKDIGMKKGQVTQVSLGDDWSKQYQINKFEGRIKKLEIASESWRFKLRELTSNRKPPKNADELKKLYSDKLQRIRTIRDTLSTRLSKLRSSYTYFEAPEIHAFGTLYAGVGIKMRGRSLKVPIDYAYVGVMALGNQAPHIVPLEEVLERDRGKHSSAS